MAYLRVLRQKRGASYYYILKSVRRGGRVKSIVLEYLGRDPEPARLKRALEYWSVKAKPRTTGTRRNRA